jgi:hypothetical protein
VTGTNTIVYKRVEVGNLPMLETHPRFPHLPLTNVNHERSKSTACTLRGVLIPRKRRDRSGWVWEPPLAHAVYSHFPSNRCAMNSVTSTPPPPPLSQQEAIPLVPRNPKDLLDADDKILGRPSSGFPPSGRAPSSAGPGSLRVAGTHSLPRLDCDLTEATLSKP